MYIILFSFLHLASFTSPRFTTITKITISFFNLNDLMCFWINFSIFYVVCITHMTPSQTIGLLLFSIHLFIKKFIFRRSICLNINIFFLSRFKQSYFPNNIDNYMILAKKLWSLVIRSGEIESSFKTSPDISTSNWVFVIISLLLSH